MSISLRHYTRGYDQVSLHVDSIGTRSYFHYDHLSTTQCLTDSSESTTDRFASDAWGVPVKRTGNSINRHWYGGNAGYYLNDISALLYARLRWISSALAQWYSVDPLLRVTLTAYTYATNRPCVSIDPSGAISACRQPCDQNFDGSNTSGPKKPSCPPKNQVYFFWQKIQNWCQDEIKSRKGVSGLPHNQANTDCCYIQYQTGCGNCASGDLDVGNGKCWHYTGCTTLHTSFSDLPNAWQYCIWQHELRRKQACSCNKADGGDGGFTNQRESDRILDCLKTILTGCGLPAGWCKPETKVVQFNPVPGDCNF